MFSASPKKLKQEAKSKNGKLSSSEKQTTAATSIAGSNEKVTEIQADQMHLDAALKESQFMFKQEDGGKAGIDGLAGSCQFLHPARWRL